MSENKLFHRSLRYKYYNLSKNVKNDLLPFVIVYNNLIENLSTGDIADAIRGTEKFIHINKKNIFSIKQELVSKSGNSFKLNGPVNSNKQVVPGPNPSTKTKESHSRTAGGVGKINKNAMNLTEKVENKTSSKNVAWWKMEGNGITPLMCKKPDIKIGGIPFSSSGKLLFFSDNNNLNKQNKTVRSDANNPVTIKGTNFSNKAESEKKRFVEELHKAMKKHNINGPEVEAAFLSNVHTETGGGTSFFENGNYSLKRWRELARSQKNIRNWLNLHKDNQEAVFAGLTPKEKCNIMYKGMNGNINPDDGWMFRGRGGIQLTGRANYQAYANYSGRQDIMSNPDLIGTDPYLRADSAAWHFVRSGALKRAREGNIAAARKKTNGGDIGMTKSMNLYEIYLHGKGPLSKNYLQQQGKKAQGMVTHPQSMKTSSINNYDNSRLVNVNINAVNVSTSAKTVSGNVGAAVKGVNNYLMNQIGASMT